MPRRAVLPVALTLAPFRSREADDQGVSRQRLRGPDVVHPFHGVNVVGAEPTALAGRLENLALLLRDGEAFSHSTAAALWGAPLPRAEENRIHVTRSTGGNRMRRPGVVGHRANVIHATFLNALPVVLPAHAWAQLGTLLGHDDLVAVGDYLVTPRRVARKPALASLGSLAATIAPDARGSGRLRRALADVRVGAESPMETRTRLLLTRAGLPEPELNPEVAGYHPDLLFPQWRLAIEYLGDQHRTDPKEWARDIQRREAFEDAGYRVLQATKADILAEPEHFLARVSRAIAQQQHPS